MVEYDVLGNERHKAICKLREMPELYPNKDGGADLYAWKSELADAIGANTELFSAIRDRLIHLLGGDQPKFSELFGILGEDDDGVDAEGRYGDGSDSPDHGSAGCACGGACGCADSGGVAPITTELRDHMRRYHEYNDLAMRHVQHVELHADEFDRLCDNIDAIHAGLERENEELRKRTMYPSETERVNMLEREVKRLTSECKTQRNNFDQATSAREHWKTLYEQALEQIHDLERDYKVACDVNERQDEQYADMVHKLDRAYEKNRNRRRQLTESQEALHRRNEGELKARWQKEVDRLEHENEELRRQLESLMFDSRPMTDDNMAEHGWYRALDADKEPIHLGDEVYQVKGGWVYTVKSISFYPDNTTVTFACEHGFGSDSAHNLRHYHAPTVEDVLREMLDAWGELPSNATNEAIIAEYAAKLKLADA